MMSDIATYIGTHTTEILMQLRAHILISLLSLAIAALVGIPCGYFASKSAKGEALIAAPFEMLRVVPSLALLILLIPVMGTGTAPAACALTVLAIPPILLNTMVGFQEVSPAMVEAAHDIGMTEREALYHVRIPQALPFVFAGLRTALVEIVSSATLAAKIGAGGLGEIIFTGLGLNRADLLVLGGFLVAALSLFTGGLFDLVTRRVLRYKSAP